MTISDLFPSPRLSLQFSQRTRETDGTETQTLQGQHVGAEGTGGAQARCSWLPWLGWAEAPWAGDSRAVARDGLGLLAGASVVRGGRAF